MMEIVLTHEILLGPKFGGPRLKTLRPNCKSAPGVTQSKDRASKLVADAAQSIHQCDC